MNHRSLRLLAAAALTVFVGAPAVAEDVSFSFRAGPNQLVLAVADDAVVIKADVDGVDEPVTRVDSDESAFFEPDPFVPDVYPSREDAAKALGVKWATAATARWKQQPPEVVRVMSNDQSLYVPLREGITAKLGGVPVQTCDGTLCQSENAPSNEAWLYVEASESSPAAKSSRGRRQPLSGASGTLSARTRGAADAAAAVKFVEKPWVSDFAAFSAHSPDRWVFARSDPDRPASTPTDAWKSARSAAAEQLLPLVVARLPRDRRYDHGDVRRTIENNLLGDRLVADRFPQKLERPYGTLYREAVLVDASDARLDPLVGEIGMTLDSQHRTKRNAFAAAGAILLVTYALYRLANAFTKGYFTWSLRTAAAVIAAGAVTAIVALA